MNFQAWLQLNFQSSLKTITIRIILTIAMAKKWDIREINVNNGFLNGRLDGNVSMLKLEGFVDQKRPNCVCKLNEALYDLIQAPRAWYDGLNNALTYSEFKNSKVRYSLFYIQRNNQTLSIFIYVFIYVDDNLATITCKQMIERFVKELK